MNEDRIALFAFYTKVTYLFCPPTYAHMIEDYLLQIVFIPVYERITHNPTFKKNQINLVYIINYFIFTSILINKLKKWKKQILHPKKVCC
jgi:hypothetical protein